MENKEANVQVSNNKKHKVAPHQIWSRRKMDNASWSLIVVKDVFFTKFGPIDKIVKIRSYDVVSGKEVGTISYPKLRNFHNRYEYFSEEPMPNIEIGMILKRRGAAFRPPNSHAQIYVKVQAVVDMGIILGKKIVIRVWDCKKNHPMPYGQTSKVLVDDFTFWKKFEVVPPKRRG